MSDTNLKVVETYTAHIQAGEIPEALGYLAEDLVLDGMGGIPHAGTYHGVDGFMHMMTTVGEHFSGFEAEGTTFHDADDFVVVRMTGTFITKDGRRATMPIAEFYTVLDGKIALIDVFYKHPDRI